MASITRRSPDIPGTMLIARGAFQHHGRITVASDFRPHFRKRAVRQRGVATAPMSMTRSRTRRWTTARFRLVKTAGDARPYRPRRLARRYGIEVVECLASLARIGWRLQPGGPQEHRRGRPVLLLRHQLTTNQRRWVEPSRDHRRPRLSRFRCARPIPPRSQ